MVRCRFCKRKAIIKTVSGYLCEFHFEKYVLSKVKKTIEKYKLFTKKDKILVAVSGGKDSSSLAYVLKELGYDFDCVFLDLKIPNFSEACKKKAIELCELLGKNLQVVDVEKEYGLKVRDLPNVPACSVCGTIKRYLLNKLAYEGNYVLATGHNLNDMFAFILMNYNSGSVDLLYKQRPKLDQDYKLAKKVKPLFFLYEREIKLFAIIKNLPFCDVSCPFSKNNKQNLLKKRLEELEKVLPFITYNYIKTHLKIFKEQRGERKEVKTCKLCGYPTDSRDGICRFCKLRLTFKDLNKTSNEE